MHLLSITISYLFSVKPHPFPEVTRLECVPIPFSFLLNLEVQRALDISCVFIKDLHQTLELFSKCRLKTIAK